MIKADLDKIINMIDVKSYCKMNKLNLYRTKLTINNGNCLDDDILVFDKDRNLFWIGTPPQELINELKNKIQQNILSMKLRMEI